MRCVRDTALRDDACRIRNGSLLCVTAGLANLRVFRRTRTPFRMIVKCRSEAMPAHLGTLSDGVPLEWLRRLLEPAVRRTPSFRTDAEGNWCWCRSYLGQVQ